jgi:hypothetical protein
VAARDTEVVVLIATMENSMIAVPPVFAGGVNVTHAEALPADARPMVGAGDTVTVGTT